MQVSGVISKNTDFLCWKKQFVDLDNQPKHLYTILKSVAPNKAVL